jgi:hypothetical protein
MARIGAFPVLENLGPLRTLTGGGEGVAIPPRGVGFVRLQWEVRQGKPSVQNLTAKLWMQSPDRAPVILQATAAVLDPVRSDVASLDLGSLGPGDSTRGVVRCWSATRPEFGLEVACSGAPFITCVKEPFQDEDFQALRRTGLPILSGYRITVSVRESSEDGKRRFDEGPFSHRVTLTPSIPGGRPMESMVIGLTGAVRGDITVMGAANGIRLEPFPVRRGTEHTATLVTERPGLDLKVDRYPPFMKVRLEKLTNTGGGSRWKLELKIEPNKVSGSFPRVDSATYRDTAIYLKIEGESSGRRLRIPVSGQGVQ